MSVLGLQGAGHIWVLSPDAHRGWGTGGGAQDDGGRVGRAGDGSRQGTHWMEGTWPSQEHSAQLQQAIHAPSLPPQGTRTEPGLGNYNLPAFQRHPAFAPHQLTPSNVAICWSPRSSADLEPPSLPSMTVGRKAHCPVLL